MVLTNTPAGSEILLKGLSKLSELQVVQSNLSASFFINLPDNLHILKLHDCTIDTPVMQLPECLVSFELLSDPLSIKLPIVQNTSALKYLTSVRASAINLEFAINDLDLINSTQCFVSSLPSTIQSLSLEIVPFKLNLDTYKSYINSLQLHGFTLLQNLSLRYTKNEISTFDLSILPISVQYLNLDIPTKSFTHGFPPNLTTLQLNLTSYDATSTFTRFWSDYINVTSLSELVTLSAKVESSSTVDMRNINYQNIGNLQIVLSTNNTSGNVGSSTYLNSMYLPSSNYSNTITTATTTRITSSSRFDYQHTHSTTLILIDDAPELDSFQIIDELELNSQMDFDSVNTLNGNGQHRHRTVIQVVDEEFGVCSNDSYGTCCDSTSGSGARIGAGGSHGVELSPGLKKIVCLPNDSFSWLVEDDTRGDDSFGEIGQFGLVGGFDYRVSEKAY
ncbi:unnamed protein product [Ambrosiozyma monospora]|uniref:Unnamed protein product n=1 Tax=Ambrosiozyma monospora TaxID=43982 RepID=A0A9W6Z8T3_AMBMO|nr:unnamed protein product [Ambrosiozyma monospora]